MKGSLLNKLNLNKLLLSIMYEELNKNLNVIDTFLNKVIIDMPFCLEYSYVDKINNNDNDNVYEYVQKLLKNELKL